MFLAAAVQLTSSSDESANLAAAESLIRRAAEYGAAFVATPENTNFLGPHAEKVERAQSLEGETCSLFSTLASEPKQHDLWLVLVGDYAGDVFRTCYQELREQAAASGVADRVHFTGYVSDEDLAHLYAACQAFVFPSYLEGFGLPAVEAMACGAPVVASDRGSLPEVLAGAGELFDPDDTSALVACLRRVLGDADYREELRSRGLKRAAGFSWERSARCAVDLLHEAGAGR